MKIKKCLLISTLIFLQTSAMAGNRPGAFTLSFGNGLYFFAPKRNIQNTDIPNASLAYNFDNHWAIEGSVGVLNTNYKGRQGTQAIHGFLYTLDGLYRINTYKRLEPYISAGIGSIGLRPANLNPVNQANINAGIGTQIFIDRSIAFRGELKDIYVLSGGKNDLMLNFNMSFLMG